MQHEEWTRALDILAFLEQVNGNELPSEHFDYDPNRAMWSTHDRGNGEQVAWLCWGLVECRKLVGLSALPGSPGPA